MLLSRVKAWRVIEFKFINFALFCTLKNKKKRLIYSFLSNKVIVR